MLTNDDRSTEELLASIENTKNKLKNYDTQVTLKLV